MTDYRFKIAQSIAGALNAEPESVYPFIEIPPQSDMGDYAFPCFTLSKTLRRSPQAIAAGLAGDLEGTMAFLKTIEVKSGYLNFFLEPAVFMADVIDNTISEGSGIGSSDEGAGKTVLVEFSSPNIAKPFHVGHAFTTILGHALYNIYNHLGYNTVRLNHLGDYGTQFGKLISAYKRWGDAKALEVHPINELLRIYVKFHDEALKDPALDIEAREYFRGLENGSPEEVEFWKTFRDLSLKEFSAIYERLGVEFDDLNGESFYSDKIPEVVAILKEKNLLVTSDGAQVVMLDEYNLPPCIILKSDGTTIYASRDVAAVLYRRRTYHYYKNIYVVGSPQALHFKQVFAVADKMGLDASGSCVHVGFGLVKFANMKFSTREGNIILLEDLLNECVDKTAEIIRKNRDDRKTDMSDGELGEIAEKIGIAAVIYTFCKNSRDRDIVFSWEEMLDFDGDSAPYVMYTYARCASVLRKAKDAGFGTEGYISGLSKSGFEEEYTMLKLIYAFGETVRKAADSNEPSILVRHINAIARAFNKFYNNYPILNNEDAEKRSAGIKICEAAAIALDTGMHLIGIDPVDRM
ncbi:MAG: arginine--tRNA ligase [Saccharofermentanales bacterium]